MSIGHCIDTTYARQLRTMGASVQFCCTNMLQSQSSIVWLQFIVSHECVCSRSVHNHVNATLSNGLLPHCSRQSNRIDFCGVHYAIRNAFHCSMYSTIYHRNVIKTDFLPRNRFCTAPGSRTMLFVHIVDLMFTRCSWTVADTRMCRNYSDVRAGEQVCVEWNLLLNVVTRDPSGDDGDYSIWYFCRLMTDVFDCSSTLMWSSIVAWTYSMFNCGNLFSTHSCMYASAPASVGS